MITMTVIAAGEDEFALYVDVEEADANETLAVKYVSKKELADMICGLVNVLAGDKEVQLLY